ncbi:MAG TPA: VirB3 family type IV secretion system protein [Bryobacteraceae bacterium]|jgi:type IV secretory pathway TrbD component|nr:VirB3 family type IV secretion system protein [Bryobacteraceae bacterium]
MPLAIKPGARALNKPLLIIGIDRKLAGLAFLLSVIVGANDGFLPKFSALALFVALWAIGRRLTRIDPNIFQVMNQVRQRKTLYDPLKREQFWAVLKRRPE